MGVPPGEVGSSKALLTTTDTVVVLSRIIQGLQIKIVEINITLFQLRLATYVCYSNPSNSVIQGGPEICIDLPVLL